MMGHTHALSGAVTFLAVSPFLGHTSPVEAAVGAVGAAGAALLPDLDHHSATPARAFGFPSRALAWLLGRLSGGHRHATHSLLGLAVFTTAAWWAAAARGWPLIVLMTLLAGMAVRALGPRPTDRPWRLDYADVAGLVHAAGAGYLAYQLVSSGMDLSVVPYAVATGAAAHIAGDMLTEKGCPLLWPRLRYYRLASINTDSWVERWIIAGALYLALGAVIYTTYDNWAPALAGTVLRI